MPISVVGGISCFVLGEAARIEFRRGEWLG